jgi:hypothetical protein
MTEMAPYDTFSILESYIPKDASLTRSRSWGWSPTPRPSSICGHLRNSCGSKCQSANPTGFVGKSLCHLVPLSLSSVKVLMLYLKAVKSKCDQSQPKRWHPRCGRRDWLFWAIHGLRSPGPFQLYPRSRDKPCCRGTDPNVRRMIKHERGLSTIAKGEGKGL